MPLTAEIVAPDSCPMVTLLSDLKYRIIEEELALGYDRDSAWTHADEVIATAMGIDDPAFDVCTYDPIAVMWEQEQRGATSEQSSSRRRLVDEDMDILKKYLAFSLQTIAIVESVSTVVGAPRPTLRSAWSTTHLKRDSSAEKLACMCNDRY